MNNMYIIYEGFQQDAFEIFEPIIKKFNFDITKLSDYGVTLTNNKCRLYFSCEVTLSLWYYNEKCKNGVLLTQHFYDTDKKKYKAFNNLCFREINKQYFVELCSFLINNFLDEINTLGSAEYVQED